MIGSNRISSNRIGNNRIVRDRISRTRSNVIGRTKIGKNEFARKMTGMNRKCGAMMVKMIGITKIGWTGNMNGIITR